ncbi:hypothetical protein [Poseidonocella sedimentorum]|uniref:hypothetical protein n=1 Tax=Poseidonocella sedimentorum TaxID=871652 RepID=UPI00116037AA|nr:hypothetical protein [Poseidonocella sedimentorum]
MQGDIGVAIAQFVPLIIITAIMAGISWPMVRRKGLGTGYFLACLIPGVGYIVLLIVASKTDKAVLDELHALREELNKREVAQYN